MNDKNIVVHSAIHVSEADGDFPDVWAAIGVDHGTRPPRVVLGQGSTKKYAEENARAQVTKTP